MTRKHKLLVGVGAGVIVGLLLIAAFSLGVYVGEHGWTRAGLTLGRPAGGPAAPTGLPGAPGEQPLLPGGGRPPDVTGRVRSVFEGTLVLATPDGPRAIALGPQTRVETHEGAAQSLDALEQGLVVAVFGRAAEGGRALLADTIVLLPSAGQPSTGSSRQPPAERPRDGRN